MVVRLALLALLAMGNMVAASQRAVLLPAQHNDSQMKEAHLLSDAAEACPANAHPCQNFPNSCCDTGYRCCGPNYCIPTGSSCCDRGTGSYCAAGYFCCQTYYCAPSDSECCVNGSYCLEGTYCDTLSSGETVCEPN